MWPCVCNALEEWDRPALGAGSWVGKGALKECDSEGWRGSPGLPSPTLHGRPTMGVGLLQGGLAHAERVGGSEMGVRLCLPPPCPWIRETQCSGSLPECHWSWCGSHILSAGALSSALGTDTSGTDPRQQQGTAVQCLLFVT